MADASRIWGSLSNPTPPPQEKRRPFFFFFFTSPAPASSLGLEVENSFSLVPGGDQTSPESSPPFQGKQPRSSRSGCARRWLFCARVAVSLPLRFASRPATRCWPPGTRGCPWQVGWTFPRRCRKADRASRARPAHKCAQWLRPASASPPSAGLGRLCAAPRGPHGAAGWRDFWGRSALAPGKEGEVGAGPVRRSGCSKRWASVPRFAKHLGVGGKRGADLQATPRS